MEEPINDSETLSLISKSLSDQRPRDHQHPRQQQQQQLQPIVLASPEVDTGVRRSEGRGDDGDDSAARVPIDPRRFICIVLFSIFSFSNAAQWIAYAPVVEETKRLFHVTAQQVNWLSTIYMIVYVLGVHVSYHSFEKIGLRKAIWVGGALNAIGATLKFCCVTWFPNFAWIVVAQVINSIAQIFVLGTPSILASEWFPLSERTAATSVAAMMNNLGSAFGMLIPPLMVPAVLGVVPNSGACVGPSTIYSLSSSRSEAPNCSHSPTTTTTTEEDLQRGFTHFFAVEMAVCVGVFLLMLLLIPKKPKTPPSVSARTEAEEEKEKEGGVKQKKEKERSHAGSNAVGGEQMAPQSGVQNSNKNLETPQKEAETDRREQDEKRSKGTTERVSFMLSSCFSSHLFSLRLAFSSCTKHPRSYFVLLCSFSFLCGSMWTISSLITQILGSFGVSDTNVGWMGFGNITAGTLAAYIVGRWVDKKRVYKKPLIGLLLGATLLLAAMLVTLLVGYFQHTSDTELYFKYQHPNDQLLLGLCFCFYILAGCCQSSVIPLVLEYGVELTYPIPESMTSAILMGGANTAALICMFGFGAVVANNNNNNSGSNDNSTTAIPYMESSNGDDEQKAVKNALIGFGGLVACNLIALMCAVLVKDELKRKRFEERCVEGNEEEDVRYHSLNA